MKGRRLRAEAGVTAPSFLWLLVFFLIPTLLVVYLSFRQSSPNGGVAEGYSWDAYRVLLQPFYLPILLRTLNLSFWTTVFCLLLSLPVAYYMARVDRSRQQVLLLLIIIPFWTNFLIRVYAWKVVLHPEGWLKDVLVFLGLSTPDASLLYNEWAVLLVLVYTYLPYAILPLYTAAEKFDFRLLEAARDLGASSRRAWFRIFLPGISQGIISAVMVVFIPALGSYIIPEMVGGPNSEMLGNKIAQRVFADRNLPQASSLSTLLILAILLPSLFYIFFQRGRKTGKGKALVQGSEQTLGDGLVPGAAQGQPEKGATP